MTDTENRPYAHKTDGELFLISEFLEREIKSLTERNAAIQAEMQFRNDSAASGTTVEYECAEIQSADPYGDRSRRYAMRIALIGIAIVAAMMGALLKFG